MKTLLKTRPTQRLFAASLLALFTVLFFPTLATAQVPGKVVVFQPSPRAGSLPGNFLEWVKPSGTVIDYTVQRKDSADGVFADLQTDTGMVIADAAGELNHIYRVRARNDDGFGRWSEDALVQDTGSDNNLLTEPRELTAVRQAGGAVLTWIPPVRSGLVIYQYQVSRKIGTGAFMDIGTPLAADIDPLSYTDTPIEDDLIYTYRVRSFSPIGPAPSGGSIPADSKESAEVILIAPATSSPEQVAAIVSEVARAIVSSTVSAVTNRISNVASGVAGLNIGGLSLNNSNMASALTTNAQAFATNSDAMKTLLGNSDFSMPLNAVGDSNGGGGFGSVGIWASGEYSDLSGESDDLDWDGELTGFHLGIDGKIHTGSDKNILIGLAVSSLNGDLDYENDANAATAPGEKGNYEIDMTTVSPYIGWRAGVVDLWASVGFGEGEVELTDDAMPNTTHKSDAEQTSFAIGGSVADMVVNKNYSVKLNGELSASEFDIDDSEEGRITEQTVDATRARISVEASRISDLENGKAFEKSAEIGARFDGGDGETGAGVEIGGKLKYHAANGFTAEGSARVLLGHSGDYQEWGIQGTLRKQVGRDGQGLAFHLTPAYGDVNSSVSQLLAQGFTDDANNTANPDYHMNLTTRLGYGIAYRGMVTPYTEMVLGTSDEYRMGINWKPSKTFNLTLLGEQTKQNAIRLQGAINF